MPLGLYGEALNVTNTSTTTYVDCGEIPASSFVAGHKYLLIANILFEGSSAASDVNLRWCHGPDGSEVDFTDGDWSRDPQGGANGVCFGGIAVFTQPGTTEQVKLMIKMEAAGTATANLGQIFAFDITGLTENADYYFAEHTTDDTTMTTTYEDGASITIVGNSSDTWWVVGDVVRNTGAVTVLDQSRLNLNGNVAHTYLNEGDDTTDKNAWLFSRPFVPDSSSVCKMQYGVASGSTGTYYSSRIFAINLTKFTQFFAEDTIGDSGSIITNFVNLATESVTPTVTGDWFYIAGFTHVVNLATDSLNIRLQDDNSGSLVSNPGYGDDEPGVYAGDPLDENGMTIFFMKSLTSGAARTINLDARDTVSASSAKNRTLVGFALALAGGATINADARIVFGSRQFAQSAVARVSAARIATRVAARATSAVNRIAGARMSFLSSIRGAALVAHTSSARVSFQSLLRGASLVARVGAVRLLARTGLVARHFQDAAPITAKVSVSPVTEAKVANAPVTSAKVADASVTRAKITVSLGG